MPSLDDRRGDGDTRPAKTAARAAGLVLRVAASATVIYGLGGLAIQIWYEVRPPEPYARSGNLAIVLLFLNLLHLHAGVGLFLKRMWARTEVCILAAIDVVAGGYDFACGLAGGQYPSRLSLATVWVLGAILWLLLLRFLYTPTVSGLLYEGPGDEPLGQSDSGVGEAGASEPGDTPPVDEKGTPPQ